MKIRLLIISLLVLCWIAWLSPALAQTGPDDFYRPWVDYRNGAVSLAFDQTPIPFALSAIHATTGFQIVVPPASATKMVNLKLDHQPLEPAVRSLISSIGYKNFAFMYDEKGHPHRAVVLSARPDVADARAAAAKTESVIPPLSADERDRMQKDLERWRELKQEERGRIEDRLKNLPESDERDQLIKLYGSQILAITK